MNIAELIRDLATKLQSVCVTKTAATQEAWWLLEKLTGKGKVVLLTQKNITLTPAQQQYLQEMVHQRIDEQKPLQYIIGSVPFCSLEILVEPPILIPRPETEEWVSWLIDQLTLLRNTPITILDLCTGSGCIALALANALPHATVTGIDINPQAIALAKKNTYHNAINNVSFKQSDLFNELDKNHFDLIVSNPPYITADEYKQLAPTVQQWEDHNALVADSQGLAFYQTIAQQANQYLKTQSPLTASPCPRIVVELGTNAAGVKQLFDNAGYKRVTLFKDLQSAFRWAGVWI